MQRKQISPKSLMARIETLSRRHSLLDARIDAEQRRPAPCNVELKRLKQERLGLRDAIRVTQTVLGRVCARSEGFRWQTQFHSG